MTHFLKTTKQRFHLKGYVLLSQNRKGRSWPRKRSQRLKAIYILSFCLTRRASKEMFNQKYIVCPLNSEINHWYGKEYTVSYTHTHTHTHTHVVRCHSFMHLLYIRYIFLLTKSKASTLFCLFRQQWQEVELKQLKWNMCSLFPLLWSLISATPTDNIRHMVYTNHHRNY